MSVLIGSARIDENGNISGGKAGDQTGQEVSAQNWYLHSKGWIVARPKQEADAEAIASNMQAGCDNDHIGYCQSHRTSATTASKEFGYDLSKVTKDCEVDCSELARICCLYAGINVGTFNTASEITALKATGKFDILTDDKYCKSSDYLLRGDILVTRTKGHTVVVLSNGSQVSGSSAPAAGSSEQVSNSGGEIKVGDIVTYSGNVNYTSSYASGKSRSCKPGKAKVTQISKGKPHPYHLVAAPGGGSTVCGWVDAADIQESSGQASSGEIKVGDIVQYSGTVHYTSSYASAKKRACKGGTARVTAISKGPHPYQLKHTEKGCTVYGWVDADKVSR